MATKLHKDKKELIIGSFLMTACIFLYIIGLCAILFAPMLVLHSLLPNGVGMVVGSILSAFTLVFIMIYKSKSGV